MRPPTTADLKDLFSVFAQAAGKKVEFSLEELVALGPEKFGQGLARTSKFLTHPVFNRHHSETEMLRYIAGLEGKGSVADPFDDSPGLLHDEARTRPPRCFR